MKRKNDRKRSKKTGMAPGSLIFTGVTKMQGIKTTLIQYNEELWQETVLSNIQEAEVLIARFSGVSWLNVDGLHDIETLEPFFNYLKLHKLTMEDILTVGQRPKIDEYENYLFTVVKMFMFDKEEESIDDEQLSLILKDKLLITFQEKEGDVFKYIRTRLKENKGNIRKRGADYLLYALMDSVVDNYFLILETLGEKIDTTEIILMENPDKEVLNQMHLIRREILHLRRSVYPLREVISKFERLESPSIHTETRIFVRDLYDHIIQIIETIEVFRDMVSGMLDLYMNSISHKMNNVMKVLTIIATIFIPLTFVAGVYGMNFDYMPELQWKGGYFIVLGLMACIAALMVYYFRKKKWI